jgi:hypothetical protein
VARAVGDDGLLLGLVHAARNSAAATTRDFMSSSPPTQGDGMLEANTRLAGSSAKYVDVASDGKRHSARPPGMLVH